jgi:hypothetical protein
MAYVSLRFVVKLDQIDAFACAERLFVPNADAWPLPDSRAAGGLAARNHRHRRAGNNGMPLVGVEVARLDSTRAAQLPAVQHRPEFHRSHLQTDQSLDRIGIFCGATAELEAACITELIDGET